MDITLFHLKNSKSQIIVWMLEELQIEYSITTPKFTNECQIPSHFTPIQYPTIKLKNNNQIHYLAGLTAIIDLLMMQDDKLIPPTNSLETKLNYLYWKNFAITTLQPYIELKEKIGHSIQERSFLTRHAASKKNKKISREFLDQNLEKHINNIEIQLSKHKWFLGGYFSVVDILMWYGLSALHSKLDPNLYPNINRYLISINNREAFKLAKIAGEWDKNQFNIFWSKVW